MKLPSWQRHGKHRSPRGRRASRGVAARRPSRGLRAALADARAAGRPAALPVLRRAARLRLRDRGSVEGLRRRRRLPARRRRPLGASTRGRARLVYDLIDAYLAGPAQRLEVPRARRREVRHRRDRPGPSSTTAARSRRCAARADAVVCSTPQQKRDIERYSDNVHVVLDAHFELGDTVKRSYEAGPVLNLALGGAGREHPRARGRRRRAAEQRARRPDRRPSLHRPRVLPLPAPRRPPQLGEARPASCSRGSSSTSGTRTCSRPSRRAATSRSSRSTSARR